MGMEGGVYMLGVLMPDINVFQVAGSLNVWGPERRLRSSYIRSLTQVLVPA